MKLSIIIPCYNAEKYLPDLLACLDKQIKASAHEVEVFLIDDGSTDNSLEICRKTRFEHE